MPDPSVLVDLAEQILCVDQVQPASEQSRKRDTQAIKVLLLIVDHVLDNVRLDAGCLPPEALTDSILRSRSSDNEVVFVELQDLGVVQVYGVLEGEERAKSWV